jgi:hypothetical protein
MWFDVTASRFRVLFADASGTEGLPWHDHFKSGLQAILPGGPIELVLNLLPTAFEFSKGRRIRTTVAFVDADNFETPVIDPVPGVHLLMGKEHPSFIDLPIHKL